MATGWMTLLTSPTTGGSVRTMDVDSCKFTVVLIGRACSVCIPGTRWRPPQDVRPNPHKHYYLLQRKFWTTNLYRLQSETFRDHRAFAGDGVPIDCTEEITINR